MFPDGFRGNEVNSRSLPQDRAQSVFEQLPSVFRISAWAVRVSGGPPVVFMYSIPVIYDGCDRAEMIFDNIRDKAAVENRPSEISTPLPTLVGCGCTCRARFEYWQRHGQ